MRGDYHECAGSDRYQLRNFLDKTGCHIRMRVDKIPGFTRITKYVVEAWPAAVIIAEQLPFAAPDGQVGQILEAVVLFTIRGTREEEWSEPRVT